MFILMACYLNRWSVSMSCLPTVVKKRKSPNKKRVYYNITHTTVYFWVGSLQRFDCFPDGHRVVANEHLTTPGFAAFLLHWWWREDQWLPTIFPNPSTYSSTPFKKKKQRKNLRDLNHSLAVGQIDNWTFWLEFQLGWKNKKNCFYGRYAYSNRSVRFELDRETGGRNNYLPFKFF